MGRHLFQEVEGRRLGSVRFSFSRRGRAHANAQHNGRWRWAVVGGRGTVGVGRWELLRGIKTKME
jgi:hypothetical protein